MPQAGPLDINDVKLEKRIKLDSSNAMKFIVFSTFDITSDAVYAVETDFANAALGIAVSLFLMLPIIYLLLQHQIKMAQAWLKASYSRFYYYFLICFFDLNHLKHAPICFHCFV